MRIAIVSTPSVAVPPARYGGTELIVATLAAELVARRHQVVLYATGDSAIAGVETRALYPRAVWPPDAMRDLNHVAFAVRDILSRDDIDVVHAHVPAAVPFAALLDVPMLYTIHHCHEPPLSELYRGAGSSTLTLVAISDRQRELLGPELAADVVHHGLPPDRYPVGIGGPHAVFIGRFAEEKGVHVAIDVARAADVPLRLAGLPHWKDEVYFRAEVEPRLRQRGVEWLGEAAHGPKVALLGGGLATLFPIDWEEPFGLVMIESMLCGTPVIAFRRGSAPEVIEPGVTGWLVDDPGEMTWRLRQLAARPASLDRARCRERARRRFSSRVMVESYLALYGAVVGARATRNQRVSA